MFCVFWVCEYLVCFSARGIPATGTALQTDYTQNVHNWELNWKAPSSLPCSISFLFLVVVLGCGCDACTAPQWMLNDVRKILKCGLEKSRLTGWRSSAPGPTQVRHQDTDRKQRRAALTGGGASSACKFQARPAEARLSLDRSGSDRLGSGSLPGTDVSLSKSGRKEE